MLSVLQVHEIFNICNKYEYALELTGRQTQHHDVSNYHDCLFDSIDSKFSGGRINLENDITFYNCSAVKSGAVFIKSGRGKNI